MLPLANCIMKNMQSELKLCRQFWRIRSSKKSQKCMNLKKSELFQLFKFDRSMCIFTQINDPPFCLWKLFSSSARIISKRILIFRLEFKYSTEHDIT
mmetsp:Transcript_67134/g.99396  ORF Transcript_67134/g.99396 Transcript_67134/m.99396 type:complete len:97 (-) Transcript_67134:1745-2035(-)